MSNKQSREQITGIIWETRRYLRTHGVRRWSARPVALSEFNQTKSTRAKI